MSDLSKNEELLLELFRRVPEDDQLPLLEAIKEYLSTEEKRDALLVELFDKYCEEEGKRLMEEAEKLNADPTFELPEGFEKRNLEVIDRAFLTAPGSTYTLSDVEKMNH